MRENFIRMALVPLGTITNSAILSELGPGAGGQSCWRDSRVGSSDGGVELGAMRVTDQIELCMAMPAGVDPVSWGSARRSYSPACC